MTKRLYVVSFICLFAMLLSSRKSLGQSRINEDSLLQVVADADSAVAMIQAHNRLSRYYSTNDTAKANYHLLQLDSIAVAEADTNAMFLAGDLKMRKMIAKGLYKEGEAEVRNQIVLARALEKEFFVIGSYNAMGVIKSIQYQNDSALYYFEKSYQAKLKLEDVEPKDLIGSLNNLGATALKSSKFEEALNYYLETIEKSEEANYVKGNAMGHSGLGNVYNKLGEEEKSRFHHRKSLESAMVMNNLRAIGDAHQNIGGTYKKENPDSAIHYFKKALGNYKQLGDKNHIGLTAMATGDALINQNRPVDALRYFEQAYENYVSIGHKRRTIDSESRLAKANFEIGNYKRARSYMDDVVDYYNNNDELESSSKAYKLLSKIAEQTGELELALSAHRKHQILKDSLDGEMYNKDVAEITTKYETSLKDAEINEQKNKIEKESRSRNFFRTIAALIGVVGFMVFFFMRNKLKQSKLLREQQNLIQSQKIEQLEKEKKILSMNAMIEGQEAERSRIAKDLHDGLGGLLSTVKAHFSNIQSEIQKIEKINVYNKANELVDEACDEVRRISHNLMPGALRLEGLKTAVEHLGEEMSAAHSFTVRVETMGMKTRMEESKEVFVYRIIQEAFNNIIKHSDATDVLVQLSETDEEYHFIVEDDGQGFDPLQIESGLGLKSIQSRVDFLKGSLDTKQGVGTTLSWHIPK